MRVHGNVYAVSERLPTAIDDEQWHEYEVELLSDEHGTIDRWDSLVETYNGVPGQRLTQGQAEEAVEEIRDDVENGQASDWFNTEAI